MPTTKSQMMSRKSQIVLPLPIRVMCSFSPERILTPETEIGLPSHSGVEKMASSVVHQQWSTLSSELAQAAERAGGSVVCVHAGHRHASSGVVWQKGGVG